MKIGIFGGSFNPVHNGHIRLALFYKEKLKLDLIIVIPANIPPHKSAQNLASADDRINMLKLAFSEFDFVKVSDIEFKISGKNYTVKTLTELKKEYSNDELYLIIGGDMFLCFETWKDYKKILSMCKVCTAPRTVDELDLLYNYQNKIDKSKQNTVVFDIPVLAISSTEIRADRDLLKCFVPEKVYDYIISKDLYQ